MIFEHGFDMHKVERKLWWLTVIWGVAVFWLAEYPPMIDLPQHAAQISLLRDLIAGVSPWSNDVWINLWTPYLLGYGISTLLSFLMPVVVAVKLTLSIAYLGFVASAVLMRRHFGSSDHLDWMLLPVFFGFSYKWGFLTFLVAVPIGLLFILVVDLWASQLSRKYGGLVLLMGLVLLASHGLMFAFFWLIALAVVLLRCRMEGLLHRTIAVLPLLALAGVSLFYFWISKQNEAQIGSHILADISFGHTWERVIELLDYSFDNEYRWMYILVACVFLAAPWLLGLRPVKFSSSTPMILLIMGTALFMLIPAYVLNTAFLYQRFAVFLFPFYAWIFSSEPDNNIKQWRIVTGIIILIAGCWCALGVRTIQALNFDQESADFSRVLTVLIPAQRVLYLPIQRDSAADSHDNIYLHFASWYQAQKHGLVDFNFAWFPPQIVRFRKNSLPKVKPGFEWNPNSFDWTANQGDVYRYFIIHGGDQLDPVKLFKGAPCPPHTVLNKGAWHVYERVVCN